MAIPNRWTLADALWRGCFGIVLGGLQLLEVETEDIAHLRLCLAVFQPFPARAAPLGQDCFLDLLAGDGLFAPFQRDPLVLEVAQGRLQHGHVLRPEQLR